MFYEEMQTIVDRAAALLPDPPGPGNPEGYARWAALTIDTGCQLARILDADKGLIRSLLGDGGWTQAVCRQRRILLLRVALCAALRIRQGEPLESGVRWQQPAKGSIIVYGAVESPRRSTLLPDWLDAA